MRDPHTCVNKLLPMNQLASPETELWSEPSECTAQIKSTEENHPIYHDGENHKRRGKTTQKRNLKGGACRFRRYLFFSHLHLGF